MARPKDPEIPRPAIVINTADDVVDAQLRQVMLGIEEEGVPIQVNQAKRINPLKLAHNASVESRLDVGIGMSFGYIVVTTDKLPENRPYLACYSYEDLENNRTMGVNAARIVKRIPLRAMRVDVLTGKVQWC